MTEKKELVVRLSIDASDAKLKLAAMSDGDFLAFVQAHEDNKRLRAALERIERWFGEFPETGKTWPSGAKITYGAEYGSNGERDYMRAVARQALAE